MVTQMIFDWAKQAPERTAVIYNGRRLSYRWFAQIIALARGYFARRDYVGSGYAVLAVRNLMNFWILSLALRSLGLTTVAVRSVAEVDQLGLPTLRCVITGSGETWTGLDGICAKLGVHLLSVPSLVGESPLALEVSEAATLFGDHVLQTSGTTGIRKLVLRTPAFDAAFVRDRVEAFGMSQDTVFSVFDFGAWTGPGYMIPLSAWTVGGAIAIEQGREFYRAFAVGISHAELTPEMLAAILAAPSDVFSRNDAIQLSVTGGAMTRSQVDQAKARITSRVFNLLASTEAGIIGFTLLETPEDHRWHRLLPSRQVEIVDESDRPVPAGEIGRLRISIAGRPTSYLNDDEGTRAFFRDGFFYPGDLAVIRPDGRMALHGRITDVINIQGQKISPAPIEARLCELFGVSGVCLFSAQNDSGDEEIHIVVETPTPIDSNRLSAALNQALRGSPGARIYYMAALPRNEMGKVLRQAIRAQALASQPPLAQTD
jgi:acyl-coenzyme A synthetase/AMP-(fatty) acid ligase